MSDGTNPVGPRGLTLLGLAAVAGIALGVHGWSGQHSPAALGSVGGTSPAANAKPGAQPSRSSAPGPASSGSAPSAAPTPGPLLSSQAYAQYAFQVWPGQLTPAAKAAEAGLAITVRRQGNGLAVSAGVNGQAAGPPHLYPAGARVYVIEASMGDESGNSDYNLGDDGLVVTDAQGRIVP
jgi:hypothetical protein